jgi:hypothetical protein
MSTGLNEDYVEHRNRLQAQRAATVGARDPLNVQSSTDNGEEALLRGGDVPSTPIDRVRIENPTPSGLGPNPENPLNEPKVEATEPEQATTTGHTEHLKNAHRRPAGGFDVQFRNSGIEANRAFYVRESRTIFVNLDHPQLAAARSNAEETDSNFRRLSFEVAFNRICDWLFPGTY